MSIRDIAKERFKNGEYYNYEKDMASNPKSDYSFHGIVMQSLIRDCMKHPNIWKFEILELCNYESVCFCNADPYNDSPFNSVWYDSKNGIVYYHHPSKQTLRSFGKWMEKTFNAQALYPVE